MNVPTPRQIHNLRVLIRRMKKVPRRLFDMLSYGDGRGGMPACAAGHALLSPALAREMGVPVNSNPESFCVSDACERAFGEYDALFFAKLKFTAGITTPKRWVKHAEKWLAQFA